MLGLGPVSALPVSTAPAIPPVAVVVPALTPALPQVIIFDVADYETVWAVRHLWQDASVVEVTVR